MSVDVYAVSVSCYPGYFLPAGSSSCKLCPKGCTWNQYLPADSNTCLTCTSGMSAPCTGLAGYYCNGGDFNPSESVAQGLKMCDSRYPYSNEGTQMKDMCYVSIPFDIGTNANFNGQSADDSGGHLSRIMRYGIDEDTVFQLLSGGDHVLRDKFLPGGDSVPTRLGYKFTGWKLTHPTGDPTVVDANTVIEPEWATINGIRVLSTRLVAEWACDPDANTVAGTDANEGKCVCKTGYYGNVENNVACQQCPCGKTTSGPGKTLSDDCQYLFKYKDGAGNDKTWQWPGINMLAPVDGVTNVHDMPSCQ